MEPADRHARPASFEVWSRLHHGIDPGSSPWIGRWVRLTHALARPMVRTGVTASAITASGVVVSAAVPALSALGQAWPLLACGVLVLAAVLDGVDGAIAGLTGTASAWGEVMDSTADRVSDLLLIATLVVLGAPVWLGVTLGGLTLVLELIRTTARSAGLQGPAALTWWERPQRVIMAAFGAGLVGLEWCARAAGVTFLSTIDGPVLATAAAGLGLAVATVSTAALWRSVRRSLTSAAAG